MGQTWSYCRLVDGLIVGFEKSFGGRALWEGFVIHIIWVNWVQRSNGNFEDRRKSIDGL